MSLKRNIFENNPKKTIFIIILVFFIIFSFLVEKICNEPRIEVINKGKERYIELREHGPFFYAKMILENDELKTTDDLAGKQFLLRTDENGFIIPSSVYTKSDFTIAFLGGSTTECAFVDEDLRFPYLVGKILSSNLGLKVNSYNAGVSGNNTMHSINILLNKVISIHPNVVVMMENINDLVILLVEKSYWNDNPTRSLIVEKRPVMLDVLSMFANNVFPNLKFYLQRHLQINPDEFRAKRGTKLIVNKAKILDEFAMNLQTIIDICKIRHITPVLMTQENRFNINPDPTIIAYMKSSLFSYGLSYKEFKDLFDSLNDTIRAIGKKNGILIIDLDKEIPKTREYIYDVVHMNNNGSKLASQKIADAIEPLVKNRKSII